MYIHLCIYVYACACMHTCMCACVHMCVYVYMCHVRYRPARCVAAAFEIHPFSSWEDWVFLFSFTRFATPQQMT